MFAKLSIVLALVAVASAGVAIGGYGGGFAGYGGGYGGYGHAAYAAPAVAVAAPAVAKVAVAAAPVIHAPQPYEFGYNRQHEDGAHVHRHETSDAYNNKAGSYGYTGPDGIYRQVNYVADAAGYRATIETNEPGTANQNPAAVGIAAAEPPYKVLPAAAPVVKAVAAAPVALAAPVLKAAPALIGGYGHGGYGHGFGHGYGHGR